MTHSETLQSSSHIHRVVVVGAGISGLCTAFLLHQRGISVTVLEREAEVGGTMKTIRDDGWLIEIGPNSALETTPLFSKLFDALGLADQRTYASEAANKRYILRNGQLHPLPMSPASFLQSKLWGWRGKIRLLKEPFVGRASKEESIAEFVERRLGREFLDYAVNPFVAGVYAGNPENLSVQSAFPKLYALEEKYGGLIKGMIRGRKERKQRAEKSKDRARLFSFRDGMQTFPRALADQLNTVNGMKSHVYLNCSVERIIPFRAGQYPIYHIAYRESGKPITIQAQTVVLAVPAYVTSRIIEPIDPAMAKMLDSIYYPPVAEVFIGFRGDQIKSPLDGFGFLVPAKEKRSILGTIWSSVLFPNRSPQGTAALTTFVGGARQPELVAESDETLSRRVLSDLRSIMGIDGNPIYIKITRWDRAIPQYNLGYSVLLKAMDRFEENFRGAFLCSNYRGGIAVGDCVMSAEKTAEKVATIVAEHTFAGHPTRMEE